jgi:hypothetical protein
MMSNHLRVISLAAAFGTIAVTSPVNAASFDGNWNVVVQTTNGHCGITQWGVEIRDGKVYAPGAVVGGYSGALEGVVSPSGRVRVAGAAGPRSGHGAGRLRQAQGSGTWAGRGPSGTCAGVWSATRN